MNMKKNLLFTIGAAMMLVSMIFGGCSKDDSIETFDDMISVYPYKTNYNWKKTALDINHYSDTLDNGWVKTVDETGRITSLQCFIFGVDTEEKLDIAPTRIEDVDNYFKLGADNELRLNQELSYGEMGYEFMPAYPYGEQEYFQYYRGLRVISRGFSVIYIDTPNGRRLAAINGRLADINDFDTNPRIAPIEALKTFGEYLGIQPESEWKYELAIREFDFRDDNGKLFRELRLVYELKGPIITLSDDSDGQVITTEYARYEGVVDAHTGELLIIADPLAMRFA
jgi:hypothetical protein